MPPHRDWTRHGVGRALLWWPFLAFVLVAAFPAVAVPCVAGSGLGLVALGMIGGALGRYLRTRRLRRAGRALGSAARTSATEIPAAPAVPALPAPRPSPRAASTPAGAVEETSDTADAEDDHPAGPVRRAA